MARDEEKIPGMYADVAKAITDNLYRAMYDRLTAGKTTEAGGIPSDYLRLGQMVRQKGGLQSFDEFKDFAQQLKAIKDAGGNLTAVRDLMNKFASKGQLDKALDGLGEKIKETGRDLETLDAAVNRLTESTAKAGERKPGDEPPGQPPPQQQSPPPGPPPRPPKSPGASPPPPDEPGGSDEPSLLSRLIEELLKVPGAKKFGLNKDILGKLPEGSVRDMARQLGVGEPAAPKELGPRQTTAEPAAEGTPPDLTLGPPDDDAWPPENQDLSGQHYGSTDDWLQEILDRPTRPEPGDPGYEEYANRAGGGRAAAGEAGAAEAGAAEAGAGAGEAGAMAGAMEGAEAGMAAGPEGAAIGALIGLAMSSGGGKGGKGGGKGGGKDGGGGESGALVPAGGTKAGGESEAIAPAGETKVGGGETPELPTAGGKSGLGSKDEWNKVADKNLPHATHSFDAGRDVFTAKSLPDAILKLEKFGKAVEQDTNQLLDNAKQFAQFSASMGQEFAEREARETFRKNEMGEREAGSTRFLIEAEQTRKDNTKEMILLLDRVENVLVGVLNYAETIAAYLPNQLAKQLNKVIENTDKDEAKPMTAWEWAEKITAENDRIQAEAKRRQQEVQRKGPGNVA